MRGWEREPLGVLQGGGWMGLPSVPCGVRGKSNSIPTLLPWKLQGTTGPAQGSGRQRGSNAPFLSQVTAWALASCCMCVSLCVLIQVCVLT